MKECGAEPFALRLRVPGWSKGASARSPSLSTTTPGAEGYIELRQRWQPGDVIALDLPMPVRLMEANPLVEETLHQIAVQRGPTVYCLESADLPPGTRITDVALAKDTDLVARFDRPLLGGAVVLEGLAQVRTSPAWRGELYREALPTAGKLIKVAFIPYALWANRGPGEMSVWLPLTTTSPR